MDADGWKGIDMIWDHERPGVAASLYAAKGAAQCASIKGRRRRTGP